MFVCTLVCVCVCHVLSHVWLFVTPWTIACQASLSMGFPKQEYWGGLPFPPSEDLLDPGIEPTSKSLLRWRWILTLLSYQGSPPNPKHTLVLECVCVCVCTHLRYRMDIFRRLWYFKTLDCTKYMLPWLRIVLSISWCTNTASVVLLLLLSETWVAGDTASWRPVLPEGFPLEIFPILNQA